MNKRRLAGTDMQVSVIGLGTVKFGRNTGVKYPSDFALPSDREIDSLIGLAHELEINLIDTAPAYGTSEERLGQTLVGRRHDFILSTKAGEEFVNGVSQFDFSEQAIRASVLRSLKRLRTDYLDILLVHSNGDDIKLIEQDNVFATLAALKQEGKIRAFGMSTKTIAGGKQTLLQADVAMVAFNPGYVAEREVLQSAHTLQKSIFVKKAFASGHQVSSATLPFILNEPGVTSVIIGSIDPKHVRENVNIAGE